ncbi:MAG: acetyl-CoA hydrolase/transferase C-terminal domain-containing protein [Bdellovibrionota bacterium]
MQNNKYTNNLKTCVDQIVGQILKSSKNKIIVATPLGLGKPNVLLNAVYNEVKNNPSLELEIHTALSLARPKPKSDLEAKFIKLFIERQFGKDYPDLEYVSDLKSNNLPKNISVNEFYFQSGAMINIEQAQRHLTSVNYTHVPRDMASRGVNALLLLIAERTVNGKKEFSLSCNPDITLDLLDALKNNPPLVVGVTHPDLPFLEGEAHVSEDLFDIILENQSNHKLFAIPKAIVSDTDFAIGFHASTLIKDNGTLQIGIGSLSDSLVYSTIIRHQKTHVYKDLANKLIISDKHKNLISKVGGMDSFKEGLFGASEMVMDGFMHLRKAGILKRTVEDKCYLRGAFFLGSSELYSWLKNLSQEDFQGIEMTRVTKINDLYGEEQKLRKQLVNARFFNTCMNMSLLGAAASDGLESGQIVSGVGGQYNFVAMAHELENGRSILMLRSTRTKNGKTSSNIVWGYGYCTIPRHLRDIVITEYGARDIRGKNDEDVIISLIQIADSRFQDELIETAKKYGKLSKTYHLDPIFKQNLPANISKAFESIKKEGLYKPFPFGSDFTDVEERIVFALKKLKNKSKLGLVIELAKSLFSRIDPTEYKEELTRMDLLQTKSFKEKAYQKLLLLMLKWS